ncbi:DUF1616 domain-containing protein [Hyphomicrobium facile]|uniref:DUF1616 domain-containing protein n=1 Tax=Hyphomicrobium facile TaxID=51670 RepID=A0A1I7N5N1_9HYPH|nr:DUF1616 domain-containing protein [Hyphomicrobium facile]SFV29950.1 Protein of unknown function [Hyphomicrobium facile]
MPTNAALCAMLAVLLLVSSLLPEAIRVLVAVPMVLLVPGYVATKVAFPREPLDLERLCFAVGVSLAVTVLIGLLLNVVHMMNVAGWSLGLGGLTLVMLPFAKWGASKPEPLPAFRSAQKLSLTFGSLLAVSAVLLSGIGYSQLREFHFTELWMVPTQTAPTYRLGITNQEQIAMGYDLEVVSPDAVVASWNDIPLAPGATWQRDIQLPIKRNASVEQRFTARLYKHGDPTAAMQRVWASIPPTAAAKLVRLSDTDGADERPDIEGMR